MRLNPKPLIDAATLSIRIRELGAALSRTYGGKHPLLLVTLKGALYFAADLSRAITTPHQVDFIRARSYAGDQSTGRVEITHRPEISLRDRHVLILEDIYDTGQTLAAILDMVGEEGVASVAVCALLVKDVARVSAVDVAYKGFEIPNHFVVGYGLDYNEGYRELPEIRILESETLA